jgi:hypothetical protein
MAVEWTRSTDTYIRASKTKVRAKIGIFLVVLCLLITSKVGMYVYPLLNAQFTTYVCIVCSM